MKKGKFIKLKFIGNFYGGLSGKSGKDFSSEFKESYSPFVTFSNICNNEFINTKEFQYVRVGEDENQNLVRKGDLLFLMSSENYEEVGESAVLENEIHPLYLNSFCRGFSLIDKDINPVFLNYLLYAPKYRHQLIAEATGFTRINLKSEKIKNLKVQLPIKAEQDEIAKYARLKTQTIDNLIHQKQALIERLEEKRLALINQAVTKGLDPSVTMKDSGVEWLGEIPEHWEVRRLKYVATVAPSNVDKKSRNGEDQVLLCNYVDVYKNEFITSELKFMKATASERQIERHRINKGDVLLTKDSETPDDIAVPALVAEHLENVVCGYHLTHVRPKSDLIGDYLFRFFQTQFSKKYFKINASGITRFGLGVSAFSDIPILIPPLREQQKITDIISLKTQSIDSVITMLNKSITLHQEKRLALITSAVTGQINVSDYVD